jgi:hypothetical protein
MCQMNVRVHCSFPAVKSVSSKQNHSPLTTASVTSCYPLGLIFCCFQQKHSVSSEARSLSPSDDLEFGANIVTCCGWLVRLITRLGFRLDNGFIRYGDLQLQQITDDYNYNEHFSTSSFSDPTDGTALR